MEYESWDDFLEDEPRRRDPAPLQLGERPDGHFLGMFRRAWDRRARERRERARERPEPVVWLLGELVEGPESRRLLWLPATGEVVGVGATIEVLGVVYDMALAAARLHPTAVNGLAGARAALGQSLVHTRWPDNGHLREELTDGSEYSEEELRWDDAHPLWMLTRDPGTELSIAIHGPVRGAGWVITATPPMSRVGITVDRRTDGTIDRWRTPVPRDHSAPSRVAELVRAAVEGEEAPALADAWHDSIEIHP